MNVIPTSILSLTNGASFLIPQDAHMGTSEFKASSLNEYNNGRPEHEHIWGVYRGDVPLIGSALILSKTVNGEKLTNYIPLAQVSSIFNQK